MNIKEMLADVQANLKKKFNKNSEEKEATGEAKGEKDLASKESFNEGDHGQIRGINRKFVRIGVFGLIVIFLAAFFMATDSGQQDAAKKATTQKVSQEDIANKNASLGKDNDAEDYEKLLAANRAKAAQNGQKNGTQQGNPTSQNGTRTAQAATPASTQTASASVPPRIVPQYATYSQPYSLPSVQNVQAKPASVPAPATEEPKSTAEKAVDDVKNKFKAAIAFALGNDSTGDSKQTAGTSETEAVSQALSSGSSQAAPANPTYSAPTSTTVTAGTIIPAMLMTGINTDVAGQVVAQIQADVYDISGEYVLIPAGSKLIGTYDNKGTGGRVGVTFTTLQTPDGGAWNVGNSFVAVDGSGYMGIPGKIHHHTANNISNGILKSALTALATVSVDRVTIDGSTLANISGGEEKPTITVEPGSMFSVYVTNNITF